jgi:TetR/AcrR family transcriptional repressor of nem operon
MVGRPREFDPDQALEAAMQAFWARGYEATSMADLLAATGLHKGSLYQAFGDKHSLFVSALKRYLHNMRQKKSAALAAAATPLDGLKAVAHGMVDMADADPCCPKGCMAINTLVELAPHDAAIQQVMGDHIERMRTSIEQAVESAQAAGQVRTDRSAKVVTSLMMTFLAGLSATMKGQVGKADAHRLLDAQFEAII